MLADGLHGIGFPIREPSLPRQQHATQQMVELLLVDFLLGALGDDSTRAYIVKITQELSCILLQLISVDIHQSLARLLFKTYIIIIGGSDNVELTLGIDQPVVFAVGQ